MDDSKRELVEKSPGIYRELSIIGVCVIIAGVFLIMRFPLRLDFPALTYHYPVQEWAVGLGLTGIFFIVGSLVAVRSYLSSRKRFRITGDAPCEKITLEVTDKFTFIKALPDEKSLIAYRYYVKTTAGTWQLNEEKGSYFSKLQPGTFMQAAVLKERDTREIMDLKILPGNKETPALASLNKVMDKVASEVKITGYRAGNFLVSKTSLLKEVKYYLVVNNEILPVSGTVFSRTTINQLFEKRPEKAQHLISKRSA